MRKFQFNVFTALPSSNNSLLSEYLTLLGIVGRDVAISVGYFWCWGMKNPWTLISGSFIHILKTFSPLTHQHQIFAMLRNHCCIFLRIKRSGSWNYFNLAPCKLFPSLTENYFWWFNLDSELKSGSLKRLVLRGCHNYWLIKAAFINSCSPSPPPPLSWKLFYWIITQSLHIDSQHCWWVEINI